MKPDLIKAFADVDDDGPPFLVVVVDAEAEFEWGGPYSKDYRNVGSILEQSRAHEVFDRYGIVPTYVVDFAVASDTEAARFLRRLLEAGRCEIGAHLNPWNTPPHEEPTNRHHSYPGNLAAELERAKLEILTQAIATSFGLAPRAYKAGRYGLGPTTPRILEDLGYDVDLSVVPYKSFAADGGPDFTGFDFRPFWFGRRKRLLEIPASAGYSGALAAAGRTIFPMLATGFGTRLRLPGISARLGLLERIRLSPEGVDHAAQRRLTDNLLSQGCRVFCFSYHSPSLVPGNTPYVRDRDDLNALLRNMDSYFAYFLNELGGRVATPSELYALLAGPECADTLAPAHGKLSL